MPHEHAFAPSRGLLERAMMQPYLLLYEPHTLLITPDLPLKSSLYVVSTVRTCLCAPETEPVRFPAKNPETETGKYPDKSTVRISFLHSEKAEVQSFSTMYDTKYFW